MRRLFVLAASVLSICLGATAGASQHATPTANPAARSCIAVSPSFATSPASFGTPAAAETDAAGGEPRAEAPLPPRTPPPGVPASTAVLEQIRAAEETLAACFAAGEYLAFTALFTPKALHDEFGITAPGETATHTVGYVLAREELVSVREAQTHADGRVSAEVVFAFAGERIRTRDVFVATEGGLLLDETVELPRDPAPLGTPMAPLDDATMQSLSILGFAPGEPPATVHVASLGAAIGLRPGATVALALGVFDYEVCGTGIRCFVPMPVSAAWTTAPASGAQIDRDRGVLTIEPATPGGTVFTVSAVVDGGRHTVKSEVFVFTPETNPLLGFWREEAQRTCGTGEEVVPDLPIAELVFSADGTFAVTWIPFESYIDYWGTYTFDLTRGTLDLVVTGGNTIPPDVDGQGGFAFDATGRLVFTDLWLGTPRPGSGPAHCGHRFG